MDNIAVSRQNHTYKKGNKENAQPAYGSKSFIKRDKRSAAPFQLKSNKKEETFAKSGPVKAKAKQVDTRSTSGEALKKVKTVQRDVKGPTDVGQAHSQAFLTEQAVKDTIIKAEAPKPPAPVPLSKPAPGMYKGKIVQSKIGSIWKSSVPTQGSRTQNSKPKIPVNDKKVNKIPVTSTLSHYKFTVETAEERRAKLAEWLASKGKTLKRPAMTTATPSKPKVSAKPDADPQPAAQCNPEPEPSVEAHESDSAAAHCADTQGAGLMIHSQTPNPDPQDRADDIVVNLCDVLEAMKLKNEMSGQPKVEQVKHKGEESGKEDETDVEEVESDEGVMETTPQMETASVVKYSVKTTPYLQSVKKAIADDASRSTSRRKSNIKDLKFLTPVRRSCRIERKSTRLPTMLVDHDPCVSSLAELVKLDDDDDANAYIYRKNPALLEDLPDQPRL
ncbi:cytoskeleton-associated protein 2-like [Micropterus salmoides]|uniref:cytoskeleton-associated protein 2-like n=1 Tax=Micropterus salmoides TaxID=27706 RepID=UPI0018ED4B61|nr:cytoskeleton-associated protein 2-like [Micropterus salmoides]XP_038563787.1 cytoskeleton-associated protein 2-like [Micropterus salmoides]